MRSFGVEIECNLENTSLFDSRVPYSRLTTDSSIKGKNPIEVVTEPLDGEAGFRGIFELCSHLNSYDVKTTNPNCGLHVHLDGSGFIQENNVCVVDEGEIFVPFVAMRKILNYNNDKKLNNEDYLAIARFIKQTEPHNSGSNWCWWTKEGFISAKKRKGVTNLRFNEMPKTSILPPRQTTGKYFTVSNNDNVLNNVKNLLLFYVVFNPVVSGMIPDSRKDGNSYCPPVSENYSIDDILAVSTYDDFMKLWYKSNSTHGHTNNHYDDSRYQNINLHSLWNRTNTVEVRSHKATTDPVKILMWVKFHMLIVDKIANGDITTQQIQAGVKLELPDMTKYLLDILEADVNMQKYVIRLINHFNSLKIPCVE